MHLEWVGEITIHHDSTRRCGRVHCRGTLMTGFYYDLWNTEVTENWQHYASVEGIKCRLEVDESDDWVEVGGCQRLTWSFAGYGFAANNFYKDGIQLGYGEITFLWKGTITFVNHCSGGVCLVRKSTQNAYARCLPSNFTPLAGLLRWQHNPALQLCYSSCCGLFSVFP